MKKLLRRILLNIFVNLLVHLFRKGELYITGVKVRRSQTPGIYILGPEFDSKGKQHVLCEYDFED